MIRLLIMVSSKGSLLDRRAVVAQISRYEKDPTARLMAPKCLIPCTHQPKSSSPCHHAQRNLALRGTGRYCPSDILLACYKV